MTREQPLPAIEILEPLLQPFIPPANRLPSHAGTEQRALDLLPSSNVPRENLR